MQDKDFLQDYEMKIWEFSPRMLRFFGLATLLNFLIIFVLSQTNLLQARACDGPFVGKICQVLDAVYVGAKLLSGDNRYVVRAYDQTKIEDADKIIWVDETGKGPAFSYPEGYFKPEESEDLLNGETLDDSLVAELIPSPNPIVTSPPNNSLFGKRQKLPKDNNKVVDGDLPDDPFGNIANSEEKNKKPENDSSRKLPDSNVAANTNKKPENDIKDSINNSSAKNSDPVEDMSFINRKPLDDFADEVLEKWEAKTVDLSKEFRIKMIGALTKNGRLDRKRSVFQEASGDKAMIEVAKRAIESVGESGWLDYLSRFGVARVNLIFEQDDSRLFAVVDSTLPTPEKANTVATGLRGLMQAALLLHKNGLREFSDDEIALLKAAKVTSVGKLLRINFELPKEVAQKMINGQLKEYQAKKLKKQKDKTNPEGKPNGSAGKVNENANSVK